MSSLSKLCADPVLGPVYSAILNRRGGSTWLKKQSSQTALAEKYKLNAPLVTALVVRGEHGLSVIEDTGLFTRIAEDIARYDPDMQHSYYAALASHATGVAVAQIEAVRNAPAGNRPKQTFRHVQHHGQYTTRTKELGTLVCDFPGCTKKKPYTDWGGLLAHTRKDHAGYEPNKHGSTYKTLYEALPKKSHKKKVARGSACASECAECFDPLNGQWHHRLGPGARARGHLGCARREAGTGLGHWQVHYSESPSGQPRRPAARGASSVLSLAGAHWQEQAPSSSAHSRLGPGSRSADRRRP